MRRIVCLPLLLCVAFSCSRAPEEVSLAIADVVADPGRYQDQTLELAGEVTDATGLLSVGIYTLADSTAEIHVLTSDGLPAVGSHLRIQGEVMSGVTIGGANYGVSFREQERFYVE